jgi:hypothetical protein
MTMEEAITFVLEGYDKSPGTSRNFHGQRHFTLTL